MSSGDASIEEGTFGARPEPGRGNAARGLLVTGGGQALRILLGMASLVLLSRFLSPADFGMLAIATTITGFVGLLQDFGMTQGVVQRTELRRDVANALFATSATLGVLSCLLIVGIAPMAAWLFGMDQIHDVLLAFSVLPLLGGLGAVHGGLLNRRMRFASLTAIEMVAATASFVVGVALAWAYRSPWAVVCAAVSYGAILCAGNWLATGWIPGRPRFGGDYRETMGFGAGVAGSNFFNFVARNADTLIIARFLGAAPLGIYDRAYKLMMLPLQQVNGPLSRVMLPVLSSLQASPERYRAAYSESATLLMLITHPAMIVAILASDDFVRLALGPGWGEVGLIFAWFGVCSLHQVFTSSLAWIVFSQGRGADATRISAVSSATTLCAFFAGIPWGLQGVVIAYVASDYLIRLPFTWWVVARRGPADLPFLMGLTAPHAFACLACASLLWGLGAASGGSGLPQIVGYGAISFVSYLLALMLFPRKRGMVLRNGAYLRGRARALLQR